MNTPGIHIWPPNILKESHVLAHTGICHTPTTNTKFSLNIPKDINQKLTKIEPSEIVGQYLELSD